MCQILVYIPTVTKDGGATPTGAKEKEEEEEGFEKRGKERVLRGKRRMGLKTPPHPPQTKKSAADGKLP